jgi:hypothetical protein
VTAPAYEVWPDDRLGPGQWLVRWRHLSLAIGDQIQVIVARTNAPIDCTITDHLGPYPVATAMDNATQARRPNMADEPPIGTVVRICDGSEWIRLPQLHLPDQTYWVPLYNHEGTPESWAKLNGNYGPAEIVE